MDGNVSSKICRVGACGNKAYKLLQPLKKQKDTVLGCMGQWYIAGFDSSFILYHKFMDHELMEISFLYKNFKQCMAAFLQKFGCWSLWQEGLLATLIIKKTKRYGSWMHGPMVYCRI